MNMTDLLPWNKTRDVAATPAPRDSVALLHRDINRLFSDMWTGFGGLTAGHGMLLHRPAIEVKDQGTAFHVSAELAGMDRKDIDTFLDGDVLVIKGEKRQERKDALVSELAYGKFERRIRLPAAVQADKASAHFKDGVLTVTLPKSADTAQEPQRINIA